MEDEQETGSDECELVLKTRDRWGRMRVYQRQGKDGGILKTGCKYKVRPGGAAKKKSGKKFPVI
jgi:hypothetical protein